MPRRGRGGGRGRGNRLGVLPPRNRSITPTELDEETWSKHKEPNWCDIIARYQQHFSLKSPGRDKLRSDAMLTVVQDLCDLTPEYMEQLYFRFDCDHDGLVSLRECAEGLKAQGLSFGEDAMEILVDYVDTDGDRMLTMTEFTFLVRNLRLAELFTADSGRFQYDRMDGKVGPDGAMLGVMDFTPESCQTLMICDDGPLVLREEAARLGARRKGRVLRYSTHSFFFGHRDKKYRTRWVHMNATSRRSSAWKITLLRLAVKYRLHPLAVEDAFDDNTRTKLDRYGNNYFLAIDLLQLMKPSLHRDRNGENRVQLNRSRCSVFIAGPPKYDTIITIQRRSASAWLAKWTEWWDDEDMPKSVASVFPPSMVNRNSLTSQSDRDAASDTESVLAMDHEAAAIPWNHVFSSLRAEIEAGQRARQHGSDYLMYRILDHAVDRLRPIVDAYADRLRYFYNNMRERESHFSQNYLSEISEIKLELLDVMRTIRPLKAVVRRCIDDPDIGADATTYLEDVEDHVEEAMADVEMLSDMCKSLEESYERYSERNMNSTLFTLTVATTVFLPAQFLAGVYGMNFVDQNGDPTIPELLWPHGYRDFWISCVALTCTGLLVIWLLHRQPTIRRPRKHRRLREDAPRNGTSQAPTYYPVSHQPSIFEATTPPCTTPPRSPQTTEKPRYLGTLRGSIQDDEKVPLMLHGRV